MADLDQFSTAKPLLGQLPAWIADQNEQRRIGAYALYENIYWNVPDTFKLVSRGAEDRPIYVPAGRTIVETLHRYMANDMKIVVDAQFGTPNDQALAQQVMTDLVRREKLYSKFNTNKRFGLMRGDWLWHIYADPEREEGSRISVFPLDPSSVFPITNPENVDEIIGWHIAELITNADATQNIRRLTYRKQTGTGGPSPIDVTDELYDLDDWGGPGMDPEATPISAVRPPFTLPAPIDQLPIYHIANFNEPGALWGSSEMRGLERIFTALNQSVSDEEISLALDGLGVYVTDAGTPVDEDGEETGWNLGPGRVVELPDGKKMLRLDGVSSITPYQDHLKYLHGQIDESMGMSPVAKGNVDVQTAESGVALMLQLGPLMSRAKEKEQIVTDVMSNMLYDVAKWYIGYEGTAFNSLLEVTRWIPAYGDKIPKNNKETFKELMELAKAPAPIVSSQYLRQKLRTIGYDDMPDDATMMAQILAEKTAVGNTELDTFGARVDQEVEAELNSGASNTEAS